MTKLILFLTLSFIGPIVYSQEYGPHAKVTLQAGVESRMFSGTVIEYNDDQIKVITCWHGTMGFNTIKVVDAQLFAPPVNNTQLSANVSLSIVKTDNDKDIMLVSGPNPLHLKIKRIKIGKSTLLPNSETTSYGYGQSTRLIVNKSSAMDYDYTTQKGFKVLSVRAPVVYGMSGGGLLHNGELFGVQSSGKDNKVSYCPADQLLEFVK